VIIAFQSYLQAMAPFDVDVPYAENLGFLITRVVAMPRIARDVVRIVSLIMAVTVLRHTHRQRDADGRYIAELEDYQTVCDLIGEMFEASVTGATKKIRAMVTAVAELEKQPRRPITKIMVAKHLGIDRNTASKHVDSAIRMRWLDNAETRGGRQAVLQPGEPVPERLGLPSMEQLARTRHPVTAEE
jgi:hypothetical protein